MSASSTRCALTLTEPADRPCSIALAVASCVASTAEARDSSPSPLASSQPANACRRPARREASQRSVAEKESTPGWCRILAASKLPHGGDFPVPARFPPEDRGDGVSPKPLPGRTAAGRRHSFLRPPVASAPLTQPRFDGNRPGERAGNGRGRRPLHVCTTTRGCLQRGAMRRSRAARKASDAPDRRRAVSDARNGGRVDEAR